MWTQIWWLILWFVKALITNIGVPNATCSNYNNTKTVGDTSREQYVEPRIIARQYVYGSH